MKTFKKIVSGAAVVLFILALSACSGKTPAEIKIKNMFSDQEKTFYLMEDYLKKELTSDNGYTFRLEPNKAFDEYVAGLKSDDYESTKVTDHSILLKEKVYGDFYVFIKTAENSYELTNPYVSFNKAGGNYGPYLYFPIHLLADEVITPGHVIELEKEYKIEGTKEAFKAFYQDVKAVQFNMEETEDGFLLKGYEKELLVSNQFADLLSYQFTFTEKEGSVYVSVAQYE